MDAPREVRDFLASMGLAKELLVHLPDLTPLHRELVAANRRGNLTRILSEEDFWVRHVADSLSVALAAPTIMKERMRVVDVGCGAGFPALPLAWANPALDLTALDSHGRKVEFFRHAARELGLLNCQGVVGRAREAARSPAHRGRYDVVTARAVAATGELIRECRGLLRSDVACRIVAYKTPDRVAGEWAGAEREARKFGFELEAGTAFELPLGGGARQFLIARRRPPCLEGPMRTR